MMMMVEAIHTSETSPFFDETTQRYIPEGRRRESLKSHTVSNDLIVYSICYMTVEYSHVQK
jgi:hypothetical protein